MRASWKPLIVGGAWNPELRRIAREASGVYVVRRISDRVVLYVGMSEQGVMWKTLQRHFQAWKTLPDLYWSHDGKALVRGRETFQHARPELLEAAIFVTSTGKRSKKDPDRAARDLEQTMIRRYAPIVNVDPGHAWDERSGAPVSRTRAPRKGARGSTRDEAVPDEEIENDAAEPDGPWEDTSDDPDDPFAARVNPAPKAHHMKRNPPIPEVPASSVVRYLRTRPNEPIHVISYDGDRSFTLKEDGRHIARLIPSRDLADWMRESLSAAKLDARLHDKLTELVGPPPGDGTEFGAWSLGGVYSNNEAELLRGRFVTDSNGDQYEQPEVAAWLESPALAQVVGVLVEQGRKLRAGFAASKAAAAQARAMGATHGLRPGMRVHWKTDERTAREAEHFGTIEALAPNDGAIILEDGRRKPGQKSVRDVSPPFRHDLNVRHANVRQIAPSDDPRHKPAKEPKTPRAAKRAEEDAARAAEAAAKPEGYGVEERGKGRTGRGAGQLRMFNPPRMASAARPRGRLVELGALTEIVTRGPTGHTSRRWALRSAPILAYDTAGRLFVVYPTNKGGRATAAARKSYARTHWGQTGQGREVDGAIVVGSARVLGVGVSVTYTTRKGADAEPVDYVHEWGEGVSGPWKAPLVVHDGTDPKVAFSGGTYRVTERGIVG